jgi:oxygen-independent coproporphyrinogen-3 oxidase
MSVELLRRIIGAIKLDTQDAEIEVTIEANPGDITLEKAKAWRALGINRLSIGIQSFNDHLLQLLGRRHNGLEAIQAVKNAQSAGFDNISIDLMYALPDQTMAMWQKDIAQALALGVQHISSYGLIYEEGTVLTTLLEHGIIDAVDEEIELQMYDYLVEQLTTYGFQHYEVSNFALPGRQSRHNSSYWNDTPYIGIGAGAHSYNQTQRQWNISELDDYIQQALAHNLQPEIEVLTHEQRHTEHIMLALRTCRGVAKKRLNQEAAERYIQQGLLTEKNGFIMATTQGFHVLNRIIEDVM